MTEVVAGQTVRVHYKVLREDGTLLGSSFDGEPLEFKAGAEGEVLPGLSRGVIGMESGASRRVQVSPDDAFGPRDPNLLQKLPRANVPPDVALGDRLQASEDGPVWTVTEITDDIISVDGNHPLAGEPLVFEVELIEITGV